MSKIDLFKGLRKGWERSETNPETTKSGSPFYWRSLDQEKGNDEVRKWAEQEFPNGLAPTEFGDVAKDGQEASSSFDRREALKLLGASLGLAGMTACVRRPEEEILPYTKHPEHVIPGVANYYATSLKTPFGHLGIVAESHEGRPTKLEGNVDHPESKGALGLRGQASVLDLYDPDRIRHYTQGGTDTHLTKGSFERWAEDFVRDVQKSKGSKTAFLIDDLASPTVQRLVHQTKAKLTAATFYSDESWLENLRAGAELAVGDRDARAHYNIEKCKVLVTLGGDVFESNPEAMRLSREFAAGRSASKMGENKFAKTMNRMYAVEANFTSSGACADHRLPISAAEYGDFLQTLRAELGFGGTPVASIDANFVKALAKDLKSNLGAALIVAHASVSADVQADVHSINSALNAPLKWSKSAALPSAYYLDRTTLLRLAQESNIALPSVTEFDSESDFDSFLSERMSSEASVKSARSAKAATHWSLAYRQVIDGGLGDLVKALESGVIETLVILGSNPGYNGANHKFAESLSKAKNVIRLADVHDETPHGSGANSWNIPKNHYLESWGDGVSFDGTITMQQPLIKPLYDGLSEIELLALFAGVRGTSKEIVRSTWKTGGVLNSESKWRKALHDGVIAGATLRREASLSVQKNIRVQKSDKPSASKPEIVLGPCPKLGDGSGAKNGWLLELPDSMTKLSWDNALLMSPRYANELGLRCGIEKNSYMASVVEVKSETGVVEAPVFVMPGVAHYSTVAYLGWGREKFQFAGDTYGVDFSSLRLATNASNFSVTIRDTGKRVELAATQDHFNLENQDTIQEIANTDLKQGFILSGRGTETLNHDFQTKRPLNVDGNAEDYKKDPLFSQRGQLRVISDGGLVEPDFKAKNPSMPDRPIQLTKEVFDYSKGQQWGMAIDMTSCLGCNACVVACIAENNIPIVGRASVLMGRELHWLRIDRYFSGDVNNPRSTTQGMACLHCENAPCEPVCPVAATVHDTEGLNAMVYNRCIGTRYCANNCPVKVRRFNYFDYSVSGNVKPGSIMHDVLDPERYETLKLQRNPDVTVRYRGVMEKCTYCTQRIQEAKMVAKRSGQDPRNLPDGAITPACAQACATDAIAFGNLNDPNSRVSKLKSNGRNYELLSELNIRPRTSYLARVRNPNPELG